VLLRMAALLMVQALRLAKPLQCSLLQGDTRVLIVRLHTCAVCVCMRARAHVYVLACVCLCMCVLCVMFVCSLCLA